MVTLTLSKRRLKDVGRDIDVDVGERCRLVPSEVIPFHGEFEQNVLRTFHRSNDGDDGSVRRWRLQSKCHLAGLLVDVFGGADALYCKVEPENKLF